MKDEPRPERAITRQFLVWLVVIAVGTFIGVLILGHGWSQELNLVVVGVLLASAAALMPRLSRWLRSRWGPGAAP
ncbi:MAG TPA: hypothetical protein VKA30_00330 [Actinomycetota bacterium]|nr:hypothetical protein [Actinomycetota bacterium]